MGSALPLPSPCCLPAARLSLFDCAYDSLGWQVAVRVENWLSECQLSLTFRNTDPYRRARCKTLRTKQSNKLIPASGKETITYYQSAHIHDNYDMTCNCKRPDLQTSKLAKRETQPFASHTTDQQSLPLTKYVRTFVDL